MNNVIITGRLTKDPELRQTQKGASVANLSVAVSEKRANADGNSIENTVFIEVRAFNKAAENVCKYFQKGSPILVLGKLQQDSWEDKNTGQKRSKIFLLLERFEFMGSGRQEQNVGRNNANVYAEQPEDDVPF